MGQARRDSRAIRRGQPAVRAGGVARGALELHGISRRIHAVDVPRCVGPPVRRPAVRPVLRSLRRSLHGRDAPRELLHARQRLRARAGAEMKPRFFLMFLLAALLMACDTPRLVRQDARAEQDQLACEQEAEREVSLRSVGFYGSLSQYYGANYQPYGRSRWFGAPGPMFDFDPVGRRMLEEGRLADSCMRAKGYQPKS